MMAGGTASLYGAEVTIFENTDRLGKKLSATGNGQGNVTNLCAGESEYFSLGEGVLRAQKLVNEYPQTQFQAFWEKRGVLLTYDERGCPISEKTVSAQSRRGESVCFLFIP